MGLQGVDAALDEWAHQHEELIEENTEAINSLAQLVAAVQLENVATTLLEQGEVTEEDVKRMVLEAQAGKEVAAETQEEEKEEGLLGKLG